MKLLAKCKTLCFTLTLILTLVFTITAFAANLDYLSYEKWDNNSRVKTVDVHKTALDNKLNGTFRYAVDNSELIVYTYLSFNESSLGGDDDIRIVYEFEMHDETYTFALDKDGLCEDSGDIEETFEIGQNFYYDGDTPQCISYAQYLGDSSGGKVRVYLFVNNSRYLVYENIRIELPTTTKPSTTKKSTKKSKSKTTKRKSSTKTKTVYKTATTKKASTTKSSSTKSYKYGNVTVTDNANTGIISAENKYLIIFASVVGITALLFIVYNMGKSKGDKDNTDNE